LRGRAARARRRGRWAPRPATWIPHLERPLPAERDPNAEELPLRSPSRPPPVRAPSRDRGLARGALALRGAHGDLSSAPAHARGARVAECSRPHHDLALSDAPRHVRGSAPAKEVFVPAGEAGGAGGARGGAHAARRALPAARDSLPRAVPREPRAIRGPLPPRRRLRLPRALRGGAGPADHLRRDARIPAAHESRRPFVAGAERDRRTPAPAAPRPRPGRDVAAGTRVHAPSPVRAPRARDPGPSRP